jgi:two-component system LytT family sensor kinase
MKLVKSFKYHIFSLIGFVAFVFVTLSANKVFYKYSTPHDEKTIGMIWYYSLEGVLCGAVAWVLSYIILYFFEKYIDFGNLKKKHIWAVITVFSLVQVLYSFTIWPILDAVYKIHAGIAMPLTSVMRIGNIPYFALIFLLWIFIVISFKLHNYINQVTLNRIQLESSLRESQLNTLKGQINPHFMFNSLNNIRGLILEDTTRARDMITRLSEMLRYSLTKNDTTTIAIKEELQTVDNYIEISKIQFEERLTFAMDVNPDLLNLSIPPMIIQMLVENAVKHGIGKIKEGGTVSLIVDKNDGNELVIIVQNSGKLAIEEGTTRLGLENIKQRLSILFGNKASFTLLEKDTFVEAKITLPLA